MEITKRMFEVLSEGKSIYNNDNELTLYCGEVFINEIDVTFDVDEEDLEEFNSSDDKLGEWDYDQETLESFLESKIVEDKWGDCKEIEGCWDDNLEIEFTNGLIHVGTFETYEEALEAYNNYTNGVVHLSEISEDEWE